MVDINALIRDKLEKYPENVRKLAAKALEFSESLPDQIVADQLKGEVRKIVRAEESSE